MRANKKHQSLIPSEAELIKSAIRRRLPQWIMAAALGLASAHFVTEDAYSQQSSASTYRSDKLTSDAARLSDSVYNFSEPTGYKLKKKAVGADGFQAASYQNQAGQVFVVYTGTQPTGGLGDWRADMGIAAGKSDGALDSQTKQALSFYNDATQGVDRSSVVVAGHSLGGYLGQIVGAANQVTTRTFNAPGVPDSELQRYGINPRSSLDVVNIVRASDPVGNFGSHLGSTVTVPDCEKMNSPEVSPRPSEESGFCGLLGNHGIATLSSDLPSIGGRNTTDPSLDDTRANNMEVNDRLRGLTKATPFDRLLDSLVSNSASKMSEGYGSLSAGLNAGAAQQASAQVQAASSQVEIRTQQAFATAVDRNQKGGSALNASNQNDPGCQLMVAHKKTLDDQLGQSGFSREDYQSLRWAKNITSNFINSNCPSFSGSGLSHRPQPAPVAPTRPAGGFWVCSNGFKNCKPR
jgi:hypothetical protein